MVNTTGIQTTIKNKNNLEGVMNNNLTEPLCQLLTLLKTMTM